MTKNESKFKAGNSVSSKTYGKGVVLSIESMELPSDGDHTFYRVQMGDGAVRNLKAGELSGGKWND